MNALIGVARQLWATASLPALRFHSSLNYHAVGMDYLCLFRDERLTVKMYFVHPGVETCGTEGFLVNPHNHAYTFDTVVLEGVVKNIVFREGDGDEDPYYERHRYVPATRTFSENGGLYLHRNTDTYRRGSSYHMEPNQIHTLEIDPARGASLLLFQYADRAEVTDLYTPVGEPPKFDARLYAKPTTQDIVGLYNLAGALLSSNY